MSDQRGSTTDTQTVVDYLFSIAKVLQNAKSGDIIHFSSDATKKTLTEFIQNPLPATIFSCRHENCWILSDSLNNVTNPSSTVVFVKEGGFLSTELPLESQLQILNFPIIGSSFETLRSLVSFGVGNYFDAITNDNKTEYVTSTRKKINELALSLRNLEQSIQTPDLSISLHPILREAISNGATLENYTEVLSDNVLLDSSFLNSLQNIVNNWVKSIQDITKIQRDVPKGSAFEEINFWISMEASLSSIQHQIDSVDVQLTLEVLKYAKRYHATASFLSDAGIQDAIAVTADYNKLMKDLPLNELLAAESLDKIEESILLIMNHLKRIRLTSYPISRALPFVEAISSDLEAKLKPLLKGILSLEYDKFEEEVARISSVLDTWEKQVKEFTNISRELLRKRGEKFIFVKITSNTTHLKDHLTEVLSFRRGHQDFVNTVQESPLLEKDLDHAYEAVLSVDVFESNKTWNICRQTYDTRIEQIENDIVEDLRSSLDAATNSNELFEIFENHKNLLERPRIRTAIQEYQSHLLGIVKDEIDHLQETFASKNDIKKLSDSRDYPDSSYVLLWANKIENKLNFLMKRLEFVFGSDWNSYSGGQRIYQECQVLTKKLNITPRFERWLENVKEYNLSGYVLKFVSDSEFPLQLNFDQSLMTFFKEVRTLSWQGFPIPHQVMLNSRKVRKVYTHAVILQESFVTLTHLSHSMDVLDDFDILLVDLKNQLFTAISNTLEITWEDLIRAYDLQNIDVKVEEHRKLATIVEIEKLIDDLSKKTNELLHFRDQARAAFMLLNECDFSHKCLDASIQKLQVVVSQISKAGYSQIESFICKLNKRLAQQLTQKFISLKLDSLVFKHRIIAKDDIIMDPPLEKSKAILTAYIQGLTDVLFRQQRLIDTSLQSLEGDFFVEFKDHTIEIYIKIGDLLSSVEEHFREASSFISDWQQSRFLWGLDIHSKCDSLPIQTWLELFDEVKFHRSSFDAPGSVASYGNFMVEFQEARDSIYSKFLNWNRDLLMEFSGDLSTIVKSLDLSILKGRRSLEMGNNALSSVSGTVELLSNVQTQKKLLTDVSSTLESLRTGEGLLLKGKVTFDNDHVFVDQLENDFESLREIISVKTASIQLNIDDITKNIEIESKRLERSISEVRSSWSQNKPSNAIDPIDALNSITGFQQKFDSLEQRRTLLNQAATLLILPVSIEYTLKTESEELEELRSVWSAIRGLWDTLEELKGMPWNSLRPHQLRKQLDDLLQHTRSMPMRIRQHQPYQKFLKLITGFSGSQKVILTLKEVFIKERHMRSLFEKLEKTFVPEPTVGDIWDLNLILYEPVVNEVISQAESERVIEEALAVVQRNWAEQYFELFEFHQQKLVRNFQELIDVSANDLASLSSMKNSPSFKVFEGDIEQWTQRLYVVYNLLDSWVEVQKQWMDMSGIFAPKSGISKLLSAEAARFQVISMEFLAITKKAFKSSTVIEASSVATISQVMPRLSDSMSKIAKALSDFLEKQRELYPRFYFIGNDDLLAILGSDGVSVINKHLKKMFQGVSAAIFDEESSSITGIQSSSGEIVMLSEPVVVRNYERVDEWMTQLDYQVKLTLANMLRKCLGVFETSDLRSLLDLFPLQIVLLTSQVIWTQRTEQSIIDGTLDAQLKLNNHRLACISSSNGHSSSVLDTLIIEAIHQRDVVADLLQHGVKCKSDFLWNSQLRFYHESQGEDLQSTTVRQLTVCFTYGFEYLGSVERLVYTPLLNQCFMAMSGALEQGLGGSPFGPAGTGKTETIKALGSLLGRMVIVFNCDESFDFPAVGRLLSGICQIGGWGCFDEFNRLDRNILSAVSSQLSQIELGLRNKSTNIELLDKRVPLVHGTGIFVTMNPGYEGRSQLPENLKKLFRSFSMSKPDSALICQVLLTAGGFKKATEISLKVVKFFDVLGSKVSFQKHYDFGLRSMKATLQSAISTLRQGFPMDEISIVVKSLEEMILPRMTDKDVLLFNSCKEDLFPGIGDIDSLFELSKSLTSIAEKRGLIATKNWLIKALQLAKVQETQFGIIVAGASGTGKSSIISCVVEALSQAEINIDPKVLQKKELFGEFHSTTRQWTDGLLTHIIRRVNEDLRGDLHKRFCVVLDGEIDPVWVETMNSVLDDNKTLTLPNGERLPIPSNIRFVFETSNLDHTTPATISRCGMVIVEHSVLDCMDIANYHLHRLQDRLMSKPYDFPESAIAIRSFGSKLKELIDDPSFLETLEFSLCKIPHVLKSSRQVLIRSFFVFIGASLERFLCTSDSLDLLDDFVKRGYFWALFNAFAGSAGISGRKMFVKFAAKRIQGFQEVEDCYLNPQGQLQPFLPVEANLDPHSINNPNIVIETTDTLRHEEIIESVLSQNSPLILCGPPGAGKTMSLYAVLQAAPDIDLVNLNFSKETDVSLIIRSLEAVCEYKRTTNGFVLRPKIPGKKVVLFADEINLPKPDEFGTQISISLLRQLVEKGGFWRVSDNHWVSLQDIQFVGACNPSTDAGRYELSERFLSHVPVIMVDYPGETSLNQIYGTFIASVLKLVPHLRGFVEDITISMLQIYKKAVSLFSIESHAHYIFTPRELTRWVRGLDTALSSNLEEPIDLDDLVRLLIHEAIRLFSDRLVTLEEKQQCRTMIFDVVKSFFPNLNEPKVLKEPFIYSNWLSLNYTSVSLEDITQFIKDKFDVFTQEIMDADFVFHDSMIQEILNIDRVLKQAGGHLMLIGPSGSGKRTLTKFVSWMNGLTVHQLNVDRNYSIHQFDQKLKDILKICGVDREKVVLLLDTSTIQQTSFFERINSLLANGQINDLFDPEEYQLLLRSLKELCQRNNILVDSDEEVQARLISNITQSLHVVFTMTGMKNHDGPQVMSSPALFNRCVIEWIGDMSYETLLQIAIKKLQMSPIADQNDLVANALVFLHSHERKVEPPFKFFQLIENFISLFESKQWEIESSQRRTNNGVVKLKDTVLAVSQQRKDLVAKQSKLKEKESEAHLMLNSILEDQNLSERKKEASITIRETLQKQDVIVQRRKEEVLNDLQLAEPAVLQARAGVQNIKKQHLTELRSMSSPPATIQLILESVCVLLGYEVSSWRDVQSIIRKDDFIYNIVHFDCEERVTPEIRDLMEQKYLSRHEYNEQAAYRASLACGPLLQWVEAQVRYSLVLGKVGPLQAEIEELETESQRTRARLSAADDMIEELEESIQKSKSAYTDMIRESENIKVEIRAVEQRTEKSMAIVESLETEKNRWIGNIKSFGKCRKDLVPQSLLSAAVLTYCGILDFKSRSGKFATWAEYLRSRFIGFSEVSITEYLNNPANLLDWQRNGLSNDQLFHENITIFESVKSPVTRYLIDGVGSLLEVVERMSERKVSMTSFLNKNFIHELHNALRFGGYLVIQDAEHFDPIINPLLTGEFQKVGGRRVIKIGDKDVDCSSDFTLVLYTRDHTAKIPHFVYASTCVIDFTITEASLEMKSLDMIIKSERPQTYQQKLDIVKLGSDYKFELNNLEDRLLESLNTDSSLLDNVELLNALEEIKVKAQDLEQKIAQTTVVINEITSISSQFEPFSKAASRLFSLLSRLPSLHSFYQFSLHDFLSWIEVVLKTSTSNEDSRLSGLIKNLFKETYGNLVLNLYVKDRDVVLVCMSMLLLGELENDQISNIVLNLLVLEYSENTNGADCLNDALDQFSVSFAKQSIAQPHGVVQRSKTDQGILTTMLSDVTGEKRLTGASLATLSSMLRSEKVFDLVNLVANSEGRPVILGSCGSFDPSSKILELSEEFTKDLKVVALGSNESSKMADRAITAAVRNGSWVMIQNIHTSPLWLESFEKTLTAYNPHKEFRLFLTCDSNSDLPMTLLKEANVVMFENTPGIKAIFTENFRARDLMVPVEMKYVQFLVTWFHAIVQERIRYIPKGFSKSYDFNDSDYRSALFFVERLFDYLYEGKEHVAPDRIDWVFISSVLSEIIYGGKVDVGADLDYLKSLAKYIFSATSFDFSFNLIGEGFTECLNPPDGNTPDDYEAWVRSLPELQPVTWLGLSEDSESDVKKAELQDIVRKAKFLLSL